MEFAIGDVVIISYGFDNPYEGLCGIVKSFYDRDNCFVALEDGSIDLVNQEEIELYDEETGGPTSYQVGGDHYSGKGIQPIEYIMSNGLDFCEGNVVKYVTRWKEKNGIEDLMKARQYIDFLIEANS